MSVYVLGRDKRPLDPCSEKRARQLLDRRRARVHLLAPFTIRLIDRTVDDCVVHPLIVKIDPRSKTTGIALVRKTEIEDEDPKISVLNNIHLEHRGQLISEALTSRRAFRRRRRGNLRYRPARFLNGTRPKGWLAPSLKSRVDNVLSIVAKLRKLAQIGSIEMELVRFDMQLVRNPEISGVEYQQGELQSYEVREYCLEKWDRKCAYCDATGVQLQIEHVVARARGGSDAVSNLTLSCQPCNQKNGVMPVEELLAHDLVRLKRILAKLTAPLRDAAAVNTTRLALFEALKATRLPVSTGTGGRTKWNRTRLGILKTHALDAACVGVVGSVSDWQVPTLVLRAMGRGSYCRTRLDRFGFPRGKLTRSKTAFGFATGDHVVAEVPSGKKAGRYVGRVAIRASGFFNITTEAGVVQGIAHRHCGILQRANGYAVRRIPTTAIPPDNERRAFLTTLKGQVSSAKI